MRAKARWIGDHAVQWWWLDLPVVTSAVLLVMLTVRDGTGIDLLGQLDLDTRRSVYTDLMQMAALFAGFSGVMFAIYLGLSGRGVRQVKELVGQQLLIMWLFAMTVPWVAALLLVLAKILDRGPAATPNAARWVAVGAVLLVAVELSRLLWVFYQLAMLDLKGVKPARPTRTQPLELTRRRA